MSLIHREGAPEPIEDAGAERDTSASAPSALASRIRRTPEIARQAVPPTKRLWAPWVMVAMAAALIALTRVPHPDQLLALACAACVLATVLAVRGNRFNALAYPALYQRWQRSFMCSRCGDVFVGRT